MDLPCGTSARNVRRKTGGDAAVVVVVNVVVAVSVVVGVDADDRWR